MREQPTPIIMVGTLTTKGAEIIIGALQAGVVDFICKPSGSISPDLDKISDELISKVKATSHVNIKHISYAHSSADRISVLIVDDSSLIRKYLRDAITLHEGYPSYFVRLLMVEKLWIKSSS